MASRVLAVAALALLTGSGASAGVHIMHSSPERPDPTAAPVIGDGSDIPHRVGLTVTGAAAHTRLPPPRPGQPGKDVVWVPTPATLVQALLRAAHVTAGDRLVDLGSGDGRIPIAAARDFGADARGIEYDPMLVAIARRNAAKAGVADRAVFLQADLFQTDFSDATVVSMYLLPALNKRLAPRLLALDPGTRVVSNSFTIGHWPPDETIRTVDGVGYLWVVPARVAGRWAFEVGDRRFTADLGQRFQFVHVKGSKILATGRLDGRTIRLQQRDGGTLEGVVSGGEMAGDGWIASRIPDRRP